MEQYVNDWGTTLAGGITNSQTTITVANSASFPTSGNFRIRIDSELMILTGVSDTTWTVTRGAEGTPAATHLNGSAINSFFTAGALDAIRADIHQTGPVANLPTVAKTGDEYWPSDSIYKYRYNGSAWEAWGQVTRMVPPSSISGWSWVNQGTATLTADTTGSLTMYVPDASSNGLQWRLYVVPATPPYTITAHWYATAFSTSSQDTGMYLYDSASGKIKGLEFLCQSNWNGFRVQQITNVTTDGGTSASKTLPNMQLLSGKIIDDGVNRTWYYSVSRGAHWTQLYRKPVRPILRRIWSGLVGSPLHPIRACT